MDIVLELADRNFLNQAYRYLPESDYLSQDHWARQSLSLFAIALVGVNLLYFLLSSASYFFLFDKTLKSHPKYLKNQISKEIWLSFTSFPVTSLVTVPVN